MKTRILAIAGAALAILSQDAAGQSYTKELPATLVKQAKVGENAASATALKAVPGGVIKSVELESEGGKLIYSYDIATKGKPGIDEVHVDAKTGALSGAVVHENAATEAAEKKAEAKEKAPAPKGKKVKSP